MAYLVGQKGQVVIAKEIRDHLGIKPGWIAVQLLVGDRVEIRFFPAEHRRSIMGSLAKYTQGKVSPGGQWEEARQAAWDLAVAESDDARENNE